MELERLSERTTSDLINFFLEAQVGRFSDLQSFFDEKRSHSFVRSEGIDIALNKDLCESVLKELNIIPIVEEFLGLRQSEILISANVDALFRLNGERKIKNGYDDALEFHRDVDSFRFVKAFVYLVDVGEGFGEHEVCIRSHKSLPLNLRVIQRQTYSRLKESLSYFELKKIVGVAGYAWLEDTTTFHRGTMPLRGDRLILSLSFNDKTAAHIYGKGYYPL